MKEINLNLDILEQNIFQEIKTKINKNVKEIKVEQCKSNNKNYYSINIFYLDLFNHKLNKVELFFEIKIDDDNYLLIILNENKKLKQMIHSSIRINLETIISIYLIEFMKQI
jgi:hypothetical protein